METNVPSQDEDTIPYGDDAGLSQIVPSETRSVNIRTDPEAGSSSRNATSIQFGGEEVVDYTYSRAPGTSISCHLIHQYINKQNQPRNQRCQALEGQESLLLTGWGSQNILLSEGGSVKRKCFEKEERTNIKRSRHVGCTWYNDTMDHIKIHLGGCLQRKLFGLDFEIFLEPKLKNEADLPLLLEALDKNVPFDGELSKTIGNQPSGIEEDLFKEFNIKRQVCSEPLCNYRQDMKNLFEHSASTGVRVSNRTVSNIHVQGNVLSTSDKTSDDKTLYSDFPKKEKCIDSHSASGKESVAGCHTDNPPTLSVIPHQYNMQAKGKSKQNPDKGKGKVKLKSKAQSLDDGKANARQKIKQENPHTCISKAGIGEKRKAVVEAGQPEVLDGKINPGKVHSALRDSDLNTDTENIEECSHALRMHMVLNEQSHVPGNIPIFSEIWSDDSSSPNGPLKSAVTTACNTQSETSIFQRNLSDAQGNIPYFRLLSDDNCTTKSRNSSKKKSNTAKVSPDVQNKIKDYLKMKKLEKE